MIWVERPRTSVKPDARRHRGIAASIILCSAGLFFSDLAYDLLPGPPPRNGYSQIDLSETRLSLDATLLPFDSLPRNGIAARLTINPPVNRWATVALEQMFKR